jgi:hypothetical protein
MSSASSARFLVDWPPILRDILIDNLERQIRSTSEIIVRGSLIVNDVLLHCLRLRLSIPTLTEASFFNACFLQGIKAKGARGSKKDYTIVKDVFENEFREYPVIERTRGDIQITIAAARYGKNLTTSVKQSFLTRQRALVKNWLQYHDLESEEVSAYHVQCLINGWMRPPVQRKRKRKKD